MNQSRLIGLAILALAIVAVAAYSLIQGGPLDPMGGYESITLKGYIGGEKSGFLADPEVQAILKNKYRIQLDVQRAGSIEMVQSDAPGVDFLWPSSQVALEIYKNRNGKIAREAIIFNSPIVLYSWDVVVNALESGGMVKRADVGYYTVDLAELIKLVVDGKAWRDIGAGELFGKVRIVTTDPAKSNSGNQFAGLLANTLHGDVVDDASLEGHLPAIRHFFVGQGFMQSSSGDLFDQYLKQGAGAFPLIAGYENQIVEFSLENQQYLAIIKERTRILYPRPTVWSSHPLIVVNDDGKRLVDALLDPEVQQLAWAKHGFRTGLSSVTDDPKVLQVAGIPATVDQVIPMPRASIMDRIVKEIGQ